MGTEPWLIPSPPIWRRALTILRLVVAWGLLGLCAWTPFEGIQTYESVKVAGSHWVDCGRPAATVAFTGGEQGTTRYRGECEGEARGELETGGVMAVLALALLFERRVRHRGIARDQRERTVAVWRTGGAWREAAWVLGGTVTVLGASAAGWSPANLLVVSVVVVPVDFLLWRVAIHPVVVAGADGLVIRNRGGGHVVPWTAIVAVRADEHGLEVVEADGTARRAVVLAGGRTAAGRRRAQEAAVEIRRRWHVAVPATSLAG